jgi:CBS domain containing-hemolysin-like protein
MEQAFGIFQKVFAYIWSNFFIFVNYLQQIGGVPSRPLLSWKKNNAIMGSDILITLLLVAINGFFVAAEFAIVKVRITQVESKSQSGDKLATGALKVVNNLDAYLSATQLGITLASLGLGWIGEPVVANMIINLFAWLDYPISDAVAHKIALPVAFTLITVLHIVFGELAPKSLAIRYPERTTMWLAYPLRGFYFIFRPFIWILNGFANFVLRSIGVPLAHEQDTHTEDEIRLLLEESKNSGNIKSAEHELLENVFKFDDRIAEQIMVPRRKLVALSVNASPDEVINTVIEEGYSRIPVYEESIDNIIGILHTKDVLKAALTDKSQMDIRAMAREPYFVSEKKLIHLILRELQTEHVQMAVVLDEFGGTSGILTMEDIVEELVGDIQDEYDNEMPVVQPKSESEFVVDALSNVEDVNKFLPEALPESENYETVAGLLNEIFGRIPEEQDYVSNDTYKFTILKKTNNTIESVLLTLLQPARAEKESIQYE